MGFRGLGFRGLGFRGVGARVYEINCIFQWRHLDKASRPGGFKRGARLKVGRPHMQILCGLQGECRRSVGTTAM